MAEDPLTLKVVVALTAQADLIGIWNDNAERYDLDHADRYLRFLEEGIEALTTEYVNGKPVEGFPEFRYVTRKKKSRGHGHYLIFRVDEAALTVRVLRVYHTRMDVVGRLTRAFE